MTVAEAEDILRLVDNGDRGFNDEGLLARAIVESANYWFQTRRSVSMRGEEGGPAWLGFEMAVWELGESLRPFLRSRRKWRGRTLILETIRDLAGDARFGKGRQTLVALLGEYGGAEYRDVLGALLTDRQVRGHAIKALQRARIGGFVEEITAIEKTETGWVRNAARGYCKTFSGK